MTSTASDSSNEQKAPVSDASPITDKGRPAKRAKLGSSADSTDDLNVSHGNEAEMVACDADENPKKKRHWESWDTADKDVFFEALAECGKDFDKMNTHMRNKRREEAKNKEQIRHFYYRTWNKIAKSLPIESDKEKKGNYEVLGLLCYGELRRKGVRGFGISQMKKLEELVTQGITVLRYKGRRCKVKPPNCKALKRINEQQLDRDNVVVIPKKINVELQPRSNAAWCLAHQLCCNPRLRCTAVPTKVWITQLFTLLERKFSNANPLCQTSIPKDLRIYPSSEAGKANDVGENHKDPHVLIFDSNGSLDIRNSSVSCAVPNIPSKDAKEKSSRSPIQDKIDYHKENASPGHTSHQINAVVDGDTSLTDSLQPNMETLDSVDIEGEEDNCYEDLHWTKEDCNASIGSLYSAYGKLDNLELYYDWPMLLSDYEQPSESMKALARLVNSEVKTPARQNSTAKRPASVAETMESLPVSQTVSSKTIVLPQLHPKHAFIVPSIPQDRLTLVNSCSSLKPTPMVDFSLPKAHKRGRAPRNNVSPNIIQRTIIPRPTSSKKLIPSAVAVNIVKQPPQLVQLSQLAPNSPQPLNNEGTVPVQATEGTDLAKTSSFDSFLTESVSLQVVAEGHVPLVESSPEDPPAFNNKDLQTVITSQMVVPTKTVAPTTSNVLSEMDLSFLNKLSVINAGDAKKKEGIVVHRESCLDSAISSSSSSLPSSVLTTPLKAPLETPTKIYDASMSSDGKPSPLKLPQLNFDQQWLGGEMSDVSFGSLLGGFGGDHSKSNPAGSQVVLCKEESNGGFPLFKATQSGTNVGLDFILDENSVDYINRFREMTAKLAADSASSVNGFQSTPSAEAVSGGCHVVKVGDTSATTTTTSNSTSSMKCIDARLPICHSEDSTGPLDGLSFVLPSNDNGQL